MTSHHGRLLTLSDGSRVPYLDARQIAWMDLDSDESRPPITAEWPESNKSPLTDSGNPLS